MNMRFFRFGKVSGLVLGIFSAGVFLASCNDTTGPSPSEEKPALVVPEHFPSVPFPADNPFSKEKTALGRKLFYDAKLSQDGSVSCGSCHRQELAFTDGLQVSRGVDDEPGSRNTPTIANSAYLPLLAFDGLSTSLEEQLLRAILNPVEMHADTAVVTQYLQHDAKYPALFASAFGNGSEANTHNAVRAMATFVRTVLSGKSPYDRYLLGDNTALGDGEKRGRTLFFSNRLRCSLCHASFDFTDGIFHNTGLYMHYLDKGRFYATNKETDIGKFKTPSLRNVALTAPYMHDGGLATLEDVVEHYNKGGHANLQRDTLMRPLDLTAQEKSDLISFLKTLTDDGLLRDSRFSKP